VINRRVPQPPASQATRLIDNMKTVSHVIRSLVIALLVVGNFLSSTRAQEISIPDPGLNAAIREELQKPNGPLTQTDMLVLTNLNARNRNVSSLAGLEAAHNLASLDLQINRLTNFSLPTELTKLTTLDVSINPLTNFFLPNGLTNLASLTLESAGLTNLTLPSGLIRLNNLDLENNQLTSFNQLSNLTSLITLDLGFNSFTSFSFPAGLTNLSTFYFAGNPLTNATLAPGLVGMTELNLSQNLLTSFTLPAGMTNLIELDLFFNQLTNVTLPADLRNLVELDLDFNRLTALDFPSNLTSLGSLHLRANLFTNFVLPAELTGLRFLDVSDGPLSSITLPAGLSRLANLRISGNTNLTSLTLPTGMTNLIGLNLTENQLVNLVLPSDLYHLESLNVGGNRLTSLNLPAGLTNLAGLFFVGNQLTNVTLPPDMTQLIALGFLANPLTTFVLSEPLAATNLAADVATLQNQGVSVFTYPLAVQLVQPLPLIGAFKFGIKGPPGAYAVYASTDLANWSQIGITSNTLGAINFVDVTSHLYPQRFYRAAMQNPPADMVFIPPNTFTMGSPTNEQDRNIFEGPQTTVTLTRGFWIGKHEVTQAEYLDITGTNPSDFPGDLSRSISSVTWHDATNYCAKLTQRELAAGRIPAGSQYRLPTEAEWECAARAGTTTRFSYGDDPSYASLTNYAWFLDLAHPDLIVHPVGEKLPNPWGLYDMAGNVWEWCQDWYGDQVGGVQTDPQGPATNAQGLKVIRGGAYDYDNSSCRSASRFFRFALSPDSDVGFRVVLVTGP
jgi:formylglycine-generating enzyme required for sulfatase activity